MADEFERLVKLVRDGLEDTRRQGDPIPNVQLEFLVRPQDMTIRVRLSGEDMEFIPDVSDISHSQRSGGYRSHNDIAAELIDQLALRALKVGRTKEER